MDPLAFLVAFIGGLLVLFFLGVPIFAAFLVCNLLGLYLLVGEPGFGMFVNSLFSTATSISLVTLPLFILMGELLSRASAIDRLMDAVDTLVAGIRGRLYLIAVIVSTILASLSGSAMGSAAMLGRTVVPAMTARGYDRQMTLGVAMGGACLAPIIPPSVLAILVGTLAQVSIGQLFQAGILPGLMIAGMIVLYIYARLAANPRLAPSQESVRRREPGDIAAAVLSLLPFCAVIGFVMGSITTGFATPSESAAIGVVGALAVAAIFRRLSLALVFDALAGTARVTGMIMVILLTSQLFSQLLAFSGTSRLLGEAIAALALPGPLMLLLLMLIPFALCTVMDEIAVMLILIPIYLPLLAPLGFDPLWFFTLFLINMSLGAIAPPVGYVLYVLQAVVPGTALPELFRASIPYVAIFLLAMAVIGAFPQTVTYLHAP